MKKFFTRTITGFFFALILVSCVCWNEYSLFALFSVISAAGILELFRLVESRGVKAQKFLAVFSALLIQACILLLLKSEMEFKQMAFVIPFLFLPFVAELYTKSENPFSNIAFTLLGIFYVAIPLTFFCLCGFNNGIYSFHVPLAFMLMIWASDTGAYIVGSLAGRTKLFERISPGKTWEGSIGGGLFSMGIAYIISFYFKELNVTQWLILSVIIIVTGTFGDLAKSLLKRSLGVKDSGNILPGHGGILDRFDSLIYASPFVWAYVFSSGNSGF